MPGLNPYVLAALIAIAGATWVIDEVKAPVKAAVVKVEKGAKKVGRGFIHVVTFGKK